jgi:hypothetical protein
MLSVLVWHPHCPRRPCPGIPGADHGQYVYVLRRGACGHEYSANGSDIWLRRYPAHLAPTAPLT